MSKKITGRECRFVTHLYSIPNYRDDTHVIKELVHYDDGSSEQNLRILTNFKRPFWTTKKYYRNHNDKKEWESLEKLDYHTSTQSELAETAFQKLHSFTRKKAYIGDVANSPYLYGTDTDSRASIKKLYMNNYPNLNTPYTVSAFDVETNVHTNHIIMASIAFKNMVYVAIDKKLLSGYINPIDAILKAIEKYIPDEEVIKNLIPMIDIVDDEISIIKGVFNKAHKWGPDFISIWNVDFDINRVLEACERANVDPKDIFSDPSLPDNIKYFKYKQGSKFKLTESGKYSPRPPEEQWHIATAPAKFYIIDAMCAYKQIRLAESKAVGGYSLDNILDKTLGLRKLKFEQADKYHKARWHEHMQENHPIEYVVYNIWDCISMLELDKKTKDLSHTISIFSYVTSFDKFNSGPKRIVDKLHYHLMESGFAVASTPKDKDKLNKKLLGLKEWIITLPAYLIEDNGLQCIEENPRLRTNIRTHVCDSDAESSYPSDTEASNVSKETTKREIINIEGIDPMVFKLQNINLLSGSVNALEYCNVMFNLPNMVELLDYYNKEKEESG